MKNHYVGSTRLVPHTILFLLVLMGPNLVYAQDWPALRGVDGLGTAAPSGILSKADKVDLKVRWKRNLGSGYSSPIVAGEHLLVGYTDGTADKISSLNVQTGETNWTAVLGASFIGENGSFDGPITTPLVVNDSVYMLDPSGKFVCLDLETGNERWTIHLVDDLESVKPLYGFATSPIFAGGVIVLQTGVKEKSLAGIDPKTGAVKWAVTNDVINSQSPVAIDFEGRQIVLSPGGKLLTGVDPVDGKVLFEFAHKGGNGSAMVPVPVGANRVVLTLDDGFSKAVEIKAGEDEPVQVSDFWQERSIKNTYNIPSLCNGNLFAYSTRILTCVDPETGKAHWKSREPGDGFLITIDGHMIINTKQGGLHVAKASNDAYQEVAYLPLFESLVWSLPAYSNDAIFSRSLDEVACVDIVEASGASKVAGTGEAEKAAPVFDKFVADLNDASSADDRKQLIDKFIDSNSFPFMDSGNACFVFRGEANNVALAGDFFGARQERQMNRVDGTEFFYYKLPLDEADQRANYMFLVDFVPQTDPLNDRKTTSSVYAGEMEFAVRLRNEKPLEMSWFAMPEWKEPFYLANADEKLAGKLSEEKFASESIETGINCKVYLPPGYDSEADQKYRTIYVFAMPGGPELGQLVESVDGIFEKQGDGVEAGYKTEPSILVFVALPPGPVGNKAFIEDLVPAVDERFKTKANRDSRSTVGFGFAGGSAIELATINADSFCGAAAYSPLVFDAARKVIEGALAELDQPMEYYIDWGRYDMFNPHENWDIRDVSESLFELCRKKKGVTVRGGMANDSTDWSSWRNRYIEFLKVGQN